MIIYNKTWLSNLMLLNLVEEDYEKGLIPEEEWKAVQNKCIHEFYSPNIFIRVGLFLLTSITSLFSSGFLSLIMLDGDIIYKYGWPLFLAVIHYLALEFIVREKNHYRSGVDDALLWISAGLLTTAFVMATNADEHYLLLAAFIFVLSGLLSLRFADSLMSLVSYLALLALVFFGWQKLGTIGNITMPFVIMLVSGGIYQLLRQHVDTSGTKFYANSMAVLRVATLLSFYAAGNYFVVKELNDILDGSVSRSIPLGWFFWSWTVGMPLVYLFFGIRQKNTILLRSGLLLIAAAAGTYKAYYRLMPIEYTMVLCGAISLTVCYFVSRFLRTPKNGFTCMELKKEYLMEELKLESLVVSDSFSETAVPVVETGTSFNGGHFGGGGSSSGY
ncbi:hypothetical protein WG906_17240 [Pedobacter sp. P351]|uniref:hypothetical protein n=1 Tax=Pedobacter superstes TaxID=3133441 RepID=UPI00309EB7C3